MNSKKGVFYKKGRSNVFWEFRVGGLGRVYIGGVC